MYRTTKEILDHVTSFHQSLKDIYFKIDDLGEKEKLDLILAFTEQHKRRLQENLNLYEKETPDKIKKIWLKYISEDDLSNECNNINLHPKMSIEDVIETALKFEDCLIRFYEKVVERCHFPEVQKIFENLLNLAKRERLDIIRNDHGVFYV